MKKLGADHPDTLITLNNLAMAYQDAGKLPQAIELFEQVRDAQVKKLGADHPDTLATLNNLASRTMAAGKLPQAIELFERVRDADVRNWGPIIPTRSARSDNLAMAYMEGREASASDRTNRAGTRCPGRRTGTRPPQHPHTLNYLADGLRGCRKLPQAVDSSSGCGTPK